MMRNLMNERLQHLEPKLNELAGCQWQRQRLNVTEKLNSSVVEPVPAENPRRVHTWCNLEPAPTEDRVNVGILGGMLVDVELANFEIDTPEAIANAPGKLDEHFTNIVR